MGWNVSLPIIHSDDTDMMMLQTRWASQIDPVIVQPWNSGVILKSVKLVTGDNAINHLLQKNVQGWVPIRFHSAWAQIYDKQDTNQQSTLTLILNASAGVTVDLLVF